VSGSAFPRQIDECYLLVALTLSHSVTIGLCLVRFFLRMEKHQQWWDDWIILLAALADLFYMLTMWVKQMHRT